jgi:hypothetical protein
MTNPLMIVGMMLAAAIGADAAGPFSGVKEIRLSRDVPGSPKTETVTIKEPTKVAELLATIKLEKKRYASGCLHLESAMFLKDNGEIKVSLCEHCFNFDGKTYLMPSGFYSLFQKAFPKSVHLDSPIQKNSRQTEYLRSPITVTPVAGKTAPAKEATVVLSVRGNEGSSTEHHVAGKLTAKGTWVRILEVLKNKGPEKLAKDKQIEILWEPDTKGLPAVECTVYIEPYRGEGWKEGLYSYRLVGTDGHNDARARSDLKDGTNPPDKTGAVMAVVMPERISVPPRDGETKFEIGLRITNRTNQDISIDLFDTVRPVLKDGQGRELPLDGGRNGTRIPKPIEVKAGQNETVLYAARLSVPEGKKHPRLVVDDRTGGIWVYHDLAPGRYTLGLEYAHPPAGRVAQPGRWVGATTTAPAAFEVAAIQKP